MNERRPLPISDEQLRDALVRTPDVQRMEDDLASIIASVERTRNGRALTNQWLLVAATLLVVAMLALLAVAVTVGSPPHVLPFSGLGRTGLVAVDLDGHIWVANADGTGRRQLTSGPAFDWEPLWSPDGTKLVYWSADRAAPSDTTVPRRLILLDMRANASAGETVVATLSGRAGWRPAWAPDSQRLAYADVVDGTFAIFVFRLGSPRPIQIGPVGMDGWDPAWSPDGRQIAFQGGGAGPQRGLYVMGTDGSGLRRLSTIPSGSRGFLVPVWSPFGDRLAAAVEVGGPQGVQRDIWVLRRDGTLEVDLSNDPADEGEPEWSPDGALIGYVRLADQAHHTFHVVLTSADGSSSTTFPQDVGDGTVAWSPDAEMILAYSVNPVTGMSDKVLAIDRETGRAVVVADGHAIGVGSWQRLAP